MTHPDLFIDFDGVLCDSLLECLASSWYAYFFLHKKERPAAMTLETKRRFATLRPYIRSGGDYLLIQELAEKNIGISSQGSFDAYLEGSANKADLYARLFSAARAYLLETYPGSWVKLNPLYAHVKPRLGSWTRSENFFILSTKEPAYIARILEANRIRMPSRRILKSPARGKLDIIRRHLQSDAAQRALLVDDQLDHLTGNTEPRIKAYLASWGYVRPEWLKAGVEILDPDRFTRLLDANLGNSKRPG